MAKYIQTPPQGKHCLLHCGDLLEFRIESDTVIPGAACLMTNLGNAAWKRAETIAKVEKGVTPGFQDWHNVRMNKIDDYTFSLTFMLTEEGHFEAKCYIAGEKDGEPAWIEGENVHINVEPATYCCSNSIYCAFVRQFGMNKNNPVSRLPENVDASDLARLDRNAYAVIPPSGTFRDLIKELDHIFDTLNCRILHLLPIHPAPTVYGRMGRYGSPYAALDFTAVNPELAEFDRKATPLDQFRELVDAVHRKNGKLFIDIAINHTGWAAKLHETHPEWLVREKDGTIHSPGAWGVVWGDLTELDHSKPELWKYLAEVFRIWCMRGVDGFRCDAGYMIPEAAWEYITACVREEFPETIFLLEGLGGDPAVTANLLDQANMNWAYSELFQNYSREQIEGYLNYAWMRSSGDGVMVHYAETHDNSRLAAVSPEYARMRTALCALTSTNGAFGFANGVEWFATEKIDVHESSALNWGAVPNQIELIGRLNTILAAHPAFHNGATVNFIDSGTPYGVIVGRSDAEGIHSVIVAINLETGKSTNVTWNIYSAPFDAETVHDLISGRRISLVRTSGGRRSLMLAGGQIVCLCADKHVLERIIELEARDRFLPDKLERQEASAMAFRALVARNHSIIACGPDAASAAEQLLHSPEKFLRGLCGEETETPLATWNWPEDAKRAVMIPPEHFLLVKAPCRFRVCFSVDGKIISLTNSLRETSGGFFALLPPVPVPREHRKASLILSVFGTDKLERMVSPVVFLAEDVKEFKLSYGTEELRRGKRNFLQANGRGALIWMPVEPGELRSRYDALLLGNLNPDYPVNRHIMLRRFRMWAVHHARIQEFSIDCLREFHIAGNGGGVWEYELPVGNGMFVEIRVKQEILYDENAVMLTLSRSSCEGKSRRLCDDTPVKIIIRPDIEDRSFHEETKASMGPERYWPGLVKNSEAGFEFHPAPDRILSVSASKGHFQRDDEWTYMIWQEKEASRGLEPNSDLFSPGYFSVQLAGGEALHIAGQMLTSPDSPKIPPAMVSEAAFDRKRDTSVENTMLTALSQFIVKRGDLKTVIAGYPWFLEWGRDTLIAARGLIAAPEFRTHVKAILLQFASYAQNGTIPNMIFGGNADNRDTSDAQLWLFTACRDLCLAEGGHDFLRERVKNGKTLLETLVALAEGLLAGTPNGITVDPDSMLVFSPSHFTWMDTNYPAGTPRQGYPIEIQALWFGALRFLSEALGEGGGAQWKARSLRVADSIAKYYVSEERGYLSDCLHCEPGTPAAEAVADDHLRPNQLYALTLGALRDHDRAVRMLNACSGLLIPGAIRSLADRKTDYALAIYSASGTLLNDPRHPYQGHYEGDEDTRRKVAYHNGTAWTWQFPAYCEAYFMTYGQAGRRTARALLSSCSLIMNDGCISQLAEILDGDYPHAQRGCGAQAWGISEYYRVWKLLHS